MNGLPNDLPGLGSVAQAPRQNPNFSPGAGFTTEDYFVWSRCDGHTSLKEIILMVGMGVDRGAEILGKLRKSGAILFDGEDAPPSVEEAAPQEAAPPSNDEDIGRCQTLSAEQFAEEMRRAREEASVERPVVRRTPKPPAKSKKSAEAAYSGLELDENSLTPEQRSALEEENALDAPLRRRILAIYHFYARADYFSVLDVSREAKKREIKRSYFRISKEFHPDRYYGKQLGSFEPWLHDIFETVNRAFEVLSDAKARAAYEGQGSGGEAAQSKEEYAREMFDRGCDAEVRGEGAEALKLLGAAVRLDPQPRYMRRAAACALALGELTPALEFARNADSLRQEDPSYARLLADVQRASGMLAEAEATLSRALGVNCDNDKLLAGIRADLDAVREQMGKA